MIDKTVRSMAAAMAGIKDGSTVLIAGFATIGEPRALIDGLIEQGAREGSGGCCRQYRGARR